MQAAIEGLNGRRVSVGVFGEQAWLAGIHEYGCVIKPKKAKYLTIPMIAEAKGKRASDFGDLFVHKAPSGELFLAREKGRGIQCVFWLTKQVVIPERAFLRTGFDQGEAEILALVDELIGNVIDGKLKPPAFLKAVGLQLQSTIKDNARDLKSPANHPYTIAQKGSSNPLVDTGDMIGAISYKVE